MDLNATTTTAFVAGLVMLGAMGKFLMSLITKPIKELAVKNEIDIEKNKDAVMEKISDLKNELIRLKEAEEKNYKYAKDLSERIGRIDTRVKEADNRSGENNADLKTKEAQIERMRAEISKLFELVDEIKDKMTDLSVLVAKGDK